MSAEPDAGRAETAPGEDWLRRAPAGGEAVRRIGRIAVNRSPLARKIVAFNLIAILILVAGITVLDPSRASLLYQRKLGLVSEAELVADVFEAEIAGRGGLRLGAGLDPAATLAALDLPGPSEVFVFDPDMVLLATTRGRERPSRAAAAGLETERRKSLVVEAAERLAGAVTGILERGGDPETEAETQRLAHRLVARSLAGGTHVETNLVKNGQTIFAAATPILYGDEIRGAVALASGAGEIEALVRAEREQFLQMVVIAILVSIGLSLVLASTIANPLSDLAAATEIGRDRSARSGRAMQPSRVRIPDLTARPDEIGRLSAGLRGMVAALYDRIDANEQFAADVAHEIKNPLASLRSAVGSMRVVTRPDQQARLLDVIEHDVRRLDRLVSDISYASRLDSELVREDEERFDLIAVLSGIAGLLGPDAAKRGIVFVTNLPAEPVPVDGLESRLAQVFVNLVTNAISFCGDRDTIRIWARRRPDRVLVVVEDTGPGIPNSALTKIFDRFYSERPAGQFGNNSGLGLAISKQIVEAHGGVIWAENIPRPETDRNAGPLGARFVVGLPL